MGAQKNGGGTENSAPTTPAGKASKPKPTPAVSAKSGKAANFDALAFSVGSSKTDAKPVQHTAKTFAEFATYCLREEGRSTEKDGLYICAPLDTTATNEKGNYRLARAVLPRRWFALDIDGCPGAEGKALHKWARQFRGFVYMTASDSAESRRARFVWELADAVDRVQAKAHGEWVREEVARVAPGAKVDPSVFRGEQPVYLPLDGAGSKAWLGKPPMPMHAGEAVPRVSGASDGLRSMHAIPLAGLTVEEAADVLDQLPDKWGASGEGNWYKVAAAMHMQFDASEEAYAALDAWSAERSGYSAEANRTRWDAGFPHEGDVTSLRSLVREAVANGYKPGADKLREWGVRTDDASEDASEDDDMWRNLPELPDAALYGVLRPIVDAATKTSEATRVGVAASTLVQFAARYGGALRLRIGDEDRTLPLYVLLVGPTGKGRKGTSAAFPSKLFAEVDDRLSECLEGDECSYPGKPQVRTHVSSGQGIIELVRDDGECVSAAGVVHAVPGVADKRLLLALSEFATVFAASGQESNTVSIVLRDAFDGVPLSNPTRTNSLNATGAHICVLGHITSHEFRKHTTENKRNTDISNGLINRFLIVFSVRTKLVPKPAPVPDAKRRHLSKQLADNVRAVFGHLPMVGPNDRRLVDYGFDDAAQALWVRKYGSVSNTTYDSYVLESLHARREPIALGLAVLLAAMNGEREVTLPALKAGLAWSEYMVDSTSRVFATLDDRRKAKEKRGDIVDIVSWAETARNGEPFTNRELTQRFGKKLDSKRRDTAMLAMLEGAPPQLLREGSKYRLNTMGQ